MTKDIQYRADGTEIRLLPNDAPHDDHDVRLTDVVAALQEAARIVGKASLSHGEVAMIRDACDNAVRALTSAAPAGDDMCPNCVTPWKCNGPHLP